MFFVVVILSIYAFFKTFGYAIYEYKNNSNKFGGIICGLLSVVSLIFPIVITLIR